ncbi:MAG: ribosome maturation factor RimM [Clostridiales bacterium]|nr:ribosome maturation factor RimM [Clostridiales bacterium]
MENYLTIAQIVKPQGIRGELKVLAMTDFPEDLQSFVRVYVGGNAYKILKVRPAGGNCAFVTLSGIADRNAAETLRGLDITALREDAPALPEDTYYIADIIGCTVVDEKGRIYGEVTSITPARTDIYELETPNGKALTFPAVQGLITDIDVAARRVTVVGARMKEVAL